MVLPKPTPPVKPYSGFVREHQRAALERADALRLFDQREANGSAAWMLRVGADLLHTLAFLPGPGGRRIAVCGSLDVGAPHGLISGPGHTFDWWVGAPSEPMVCAAFLDVGVDSDTAANTVKRLLDFPGLAPIVYASARALHERLESLAWAGRPGRADIVGEYARVMRRAPESVRPRPGEGIAGLLPGVAYPQPAAGWLCAIQQRFAMLWWAENKPNPSVKIESRNTDSAKGDLP